MKFDSGTRTRIYVDMVLDVDPSGSTIEIGVDGQWYPAEWQDDPVVAEEGKWIQTARTSDHFAGPEADTVAGTIVLGLGRHLSKTRVKTIDDVLTDESSLIVVE